MAKQRGIHQIKGKINNLCYYEQKYVRGGLIRRINEAMSERLKTDPVFANTRLANTFYGAFSMLAKAILSVSSFRSRTLMYPSRQAKLTASLMRLYKSSSGESYSSSIAVTEFRVYDILPLLDNLSKVKINIYFPTISRYRNGEDLSRGLRLLIPETYLYNYCRSFKVDRIQFEFLGLSSIGNVFFDSTSKKYVSPTVIPARNISTHTWEVGDGDFDELFSVTNNTEELTLGFLSILPVKSGAGATARIVTSGAIGAYFVF